MSGLGELAARSDFLVYENGSTFFALGHDCTSLVLTVFHFAFCRYRVMTPPIATQAHCSTVFELPHVYRYLLIV